MNAETSTITGMEVKKSTFPMEGKASLKIRPNPSFDNLMAEVRPSILALLTSP